jgi:hypothetical protein
MPTIQDIPIALTADQVVTSGGRSRARPALLRDADEAIALGQTLWKPRAVYDWFDVLATEGEEVQLASPSKPDVGATLRVGPKANLMEGAHRALVAVSTIGPELESEAQQLQARGESLQSFMLDSAGVIAVGAVGETVRCMAEEEAAALGWGVGLALSPGSLVGWSVRGQRELCSLLALDSIGVRLNGHCVLEPHKSTSVVIGMGPDFGAAKVGSACKYCALQNSCWRRREDLS